MNLAHYSDNQIVWVVIFLDYSFLLLLKDVCLFPFDATDQFNNGISFIFFLLIIIQMNTWTMNDAHVYR